MPRQKYPRIFFISDLHFTDRERDEYRFDIFEWITKRILKEEADYLFILGDITDSKDNHSAALVNRILDEIKALVEATGVQVRMLKGNHDYIEPSRPFFRFLRHEHARFITEPTMERMSGKNVLWLPHTRHYKRDWKGVTTMFPEADFILMHQTLVGAVASNGMAMDHGVPKGVFKKASKGCILLSGDIHVPQTLGRVTYVGAPYPITFGDSYQPRVLYYDGKELHSLDRKTIRKHTVTLNCDENAIEFIRNNEYGDGDQVKLRINVPQEHLESGPEIKRGFVDAFEEMDVFVASAEIRVPAPTQVRDIKSNKHGKSPEQVLDEYGQAFGISKKVMKVGKELLSSG